MPAFCATSTALIMAESWGTPTPATIRVVQIEPGPMPTLTASAPASINALVPSAVSPTLPAIMRTELESVLMRADTVEYHLRMAVGCINNNHIDRPHRLEVGTVHTLCRQLLSLLPHARPPLIILGGIGVKNGFFHIFDSDQSGAITLASSTTSNFSIRF